MAGNKRKKKEVSLNNVIAIVQELIEENSPWDSIKSLQTDVRSIQTKLNPYPDITDAMKSDNTHYAFLNGKFETIAGPSELVLACNRDTAYSLALESLQRGVLRLSGDPEMDEEIHDLLGDDIFNELAAKSVATLELKPQLSKEQQLEQAKEAYYQQKEHEQKMLEMANERATDNVKPTKE